MNLTSLYRLTVPISVALVSSTALAQHGAHPPMPGQRYVIECRFRAEGRDQTVSTPLLLSSALSATKLSQAIELPAPLKPMRVTQYLAEGIAEQKVEAVSTDDGQPAVRLFITGPTQTVERWLIAGDAERNRLTSLIGTWRYMSAADSKQREELLNQFKNERTRDPRLIIAAQDGSKARQIPLEIGKTQTLEDLACKVRVVHFYSNLGYDEKTKEAVNKSDERLNPAVLVEIERGGNKEKRWAYAKLPGFNTEGSEAIPLRVSLDCPIDSKQTTPDYLLVTVGGQTNEVWSRHGDKTTVKQLALKTQLPIAASQYKFHIEEFVPSAKLHETFGPAGDSSGTAAVKIETTDASGAAVTLWIGLGKRRMLLTPIGPMSVSFVPERMGSPGVHP